MFRSRKSTSSTPLRFEGRSVQLLAAWTLVIAGAASTASSLTSARPSPTASGLSSPSSAPAAAPGVVAARGPRR